VGKQINDTISVYTRQGMELRVPQEFVANGCAKLLRHRG